MPVQWHSWQFLHMRRGANVHAWCTQPSGCIRCSQLVACTAAWGFIALAQHCSTRRVLPTWHLPGALMTPLGTGFRAGRVVHFVVHHKLDNMPPLCLFRPCARLFVGQYLLLYFATGGLQHGRRFKVLAYGGGVLWCCTVAVLQQWAACCQPHLASCRTTARPGLSR